MSEILRVNNLTKSFVKDGKHFFAVKDVSFHLNKGECLGIVGESGCGKSTTVNLITRLKMADSGEVRFNDIDMIHADKKQLQKAYKKIQMVFQMPQDSFDPRQKLKDSILEPLYSNGFDKKFINKRLRELLPLVELDEKIVTKYPHQVSGGQCQRAAIARALAIEPEILICDEATSALDATIQKQIIILLKNLQRQMNLSILFICHDLALIQHMCDRVIVMYEGKIVESGTVDEVIKNPQDEYTKKLIASAL